MLRKVKGSHRGIEARPSIIPPLVWPAVQVLSRFAGNPFSAEGSTMTGSHDHTESSHAHDHDPAERWKHDGVRVVPGNQLDPNVPSTAGMDRKAAINFARVGAQKLWAGTVTIRPDAKTGAHHHGHLESVIYVVRGKARMRWGERLQFTAEAGPGDFHLRAALRAASGDQRQPRRGAGMRAGAQRRRSRGHQSRHRAGGEAGDGVVGGPRASRSRGAQVTDGSTPDGAKAANSHNGRRTS